MQTNESKPVSNVNVNVNVNGNVNEINTPLGVVVGPNGSEVLEAPGQYLHVVGITDRQRQMLMALDKSLGVVTEAARMINMDPSTHHRWIKQNDAYKEAVMSVKDASLDFAETALFEKMKKGDTAAIIFYLKTQGKVRGYVERNELTGNEGGPIIQIAGNI
jgi:hypothetical protein